MLDLKLLSQLILYIHIVCNTASYKCLHIMNIFYHLIKNVQSFSKKQSSEIKELFNIWAGVMQPFDTFGRCRFTTVKYCVEKIVVGLKYEIME